MKSNRISNRRLGDLAIILFAILAVYLIWDGINKQSFWGVCPGIGLLLVLASILYLKKPEDTAEKKTVERIKAEVSPEAQPEVLEIYQRLKTTSLEGMFAKILDDAKGNLSEVKKLAAIAESAGTKAFLENRW